MRIRLAACAFVAFTGLLLVPPASAEILEDVECVAPAPAAQGTARRNTNIQVTATFRNWDRQNSVVVTKGALGQHLGNVTLIGPIAFPPGQNETVLVTVPSGTFNPPPQGCQNCTGWTTPGTATYTLNNVRIPPQARPGTFITLGFGFFGRKSSEPVGTRETLGQSACIIEVVP